MRRGRALGAGLGVLSIAFAIAQLGCASSSAPGAFDGGAVADDAGLAFTDAGGGDAAAPRSDAGLPAEVGDRACSDFVDNNADGVADCSADSCRTSRICCVQSTDPGCCVAPTTLDLLVDTSSCAPGTALAGCVAGATLFGTPAPVRVTTIDDMGGCATGADVIAPQGDLGSDGGLLLARSVDTSASTVVLDATVGISLTASTTLDAVAFGLTDQGDLASAGFARVTPSIAVVWSATDRALRVVTGEIVYPQHPLTALLGPAPTCGELEVRITTHAAGSADVQVRRAGSVLETDWQTIETALPFRASPLSRPVIYGRTTNPGTTGVHAWLRSLSVGSTVCDLIAPARSTTTAFESAPTDVLSIRSVSRVGSHVAYELDGTLYAGGVDGNGHVIAPAGPTGRPLVAPGAASFAARRVEDPELVSIGMNLRLFFTGVDATGRRAIGYVDYDADLTNPVAGSVPRAIDLGPDASVSGTDGPSYFEQPGGVDGMVIRWLVYRAILVTGGSELRAVQLSGPSAPLTGTETPSAAGAFRTDASPTSDTNVMAANRTGLATAFDADEVASPMVYVQNGVYRVLYAGRHGARWSIGMLRSADFQHFERASDAPVLTGTGTGFDAVSVMDPFAYVSGTSLALYYTGSDGSVLRPGLATQAVLP
jgi:hypothetical protein